jgi:hypothetical protein
VEVKKMKKRIIYLVLALMLLSLSGIVTAQNRGCHNGRGNQHSQEVRGCDSSGDSGSNNNNGSNNNSGSSDNGGSTDDSSNSNSSHPRGLSNRGPRPGAGCHGLENALSHHSEDNPAYEILIGVLTAHGCDSDGDGVIDVFDECADTPEDAEVDEFGCELGDPDLIIAFDTPEIDGSCALVGGVTECTLTVNFIASNIGDADVDADFDVTAVADVMGNETVTIMGGLVAGTSTSGSITIGPVIGWCYDPDCTVNLSVDSGSAVEESDETNNEATITQLG